MIRISQGVAVSISLVVTVVTVGWDDIVLLHLVRRCLMDFIGAIVREAVKVIVIVNQETQRILEEERVLKD